MATDRVLTDTLPKFLYRAEQVRAMDDYAINTLGILGLYLMQNAGAVSFQIMRKQWPKVNRISIFAGSGNNGGDGYIVAKLAMEAELTVKVLALAPPEQLRGDARLAWQAFQSAGGTIETFTINRCPEDGLIVDGLLGTGLDREVSGQYADAIKSINRFNGPVLALDIPSGLHADTGFPLGNAVRADHTVTFIGLKQGLFTGYGQEYCGHINYASLGVPPAVQKSQQPSAELIRVDDVDLPPRNQNAHKGNFGHVLVIGGETGYQGAALLAAEAAMRVGSGLVSIATRQSHASVMNLTRPEIMCHGVEHGDELLELSQRATVIAIGPGLGQSSWGREMLNTIFQHDLPVVIDADALNLLAQQRCFRDNWILTPHPGEAARLLEITVREVQKDRIAAATAIQKQYGGICVLKGSGSVVFEKETLLGICPLGNPGMATGGMGDVLTGVIAGLLAQRLTLGNAARFGTIIHSTAADLAAKAGERGLLAGDLMVHLRELVNR